MKRHRGASLQSMMLERNECTRCGLDSRFVLATRITFRASGVKKRGKNAAHAAVHVEMKIVADP